MKIIIQLCALITQETSTLISYDVINKTQKNQNVCQSSKKGFRTALTKTLKLL